MMSWETRAEANYKDGGLSMCLPKVDGKNSRAVKAT